MNIAIVIFNSELMIPSFPYTLSVFARNVPSRGCARCCQLVPVHTLINYACHCLSLCLGICEDMEISTEKFVYVTVDSLPDWTFYHDIYNSNNNNSNDLIIFKY